MKIMANVIQENNTQKHITFQYNTYKEREYNNIKKGGQKKKWVTEALSEMWEISRTRTETLLHEKWDPEDQEKIEQLEELAKQLTDETQRV